MSYMKYKNPIVFGRGPRLFEVTRGESPKNVRTRYLKIENLDVFHSWYFILILGTVTLLFLVEVQGHMRSAGVKWKTL